MQTMDKILSTDRADKEIEDVNTSFICLESKVVRVILSTTDLVKACNRSKLQKDIGKILFPDPEDTSVKIHKDTFRKILL